ncbi:hypothetical protein [Brevibacillus antibioticus]|nr:hypothetical protein [Brevibacillus antibioticus]
MTSRVNVRRRYLRLLGFFHTKIYFLGVVEKSVNRSLLRVFW